MRKEGEEEDEEEREKDNEKEEDEKEEECTGYKRARVSCSVILFSRQEQLCNLTPQQKNSACFQCSLV